MVHCRLLAAGGSPPLGLNRNTASKWLLSIMQASNPFRPPWNARITNDGHLAVAAALLHCAAASSEAGVGAQLLASSLIYGRIEVAQRVLEAFPGAYFHRNHQSLAVSAVRFVVQMLLQASCLCPARVIVRMPSLPAVMAASVMAAGGLEAWYVCMRILSLLQEQYLLCSPLSMINSLPKLSPVCGGGVIGALGQGPYRGPGPLEGL
jgi:hypothetical protein